MSKNIPDINVNLDTYGSFIDRVNQVLSTLRTEVLTANSTLGETGSALAPLNARLYGTFQANTISVESAFSANSSVLTINTPVRVNGSLGGAGQVLTSNGSAVFWSTPAASSGTVTQINTGAGLSGGPITGSGSIQVRANTGIIANTSGLFADPAYIQSVVNISGNATQLQSRTWEAPGTIGSGTANTGTFTTLSALNAIRFGPTNATLVNTSGIVSPGNIDAITPASGTTGGLRLRARADNNFAYIQVTNNAGTSEWSHIAIQPTLWTLTTDLRIQGSIEVGYRNLPQVVINSSQGIETAQWGGRHIYKTTTNAITLTVPDNSATPCPIGTAITIINDSSSGNITISQTGSTILQLGGSITTGNRTIAPGGFATMVKVQTNKWIVSGPGVS